MITAVMVCVQTFPLICRVNAKQQAHELSISYGCFQEVVLWSLFCVCLIAGWVPITHFYIVATKAIGSISESTWQQFQELSATTLFVPLLTCFLCKRFFGDGSATHYKQHISFAITLSQYTTSNGRYFCFVIFFNATLRFFPLSLQSFF